MQVLSDKKAFVSIDFSVISISVSIMDHGIGIPTEELEKIFKPLYRASNTYGIGWAWNRIGNRKKNCRLA